MKTEFSEISIITRIIIVCYAYQNFIIKYVTRYYVERLMVAIYQKLT